MTGSFCGLACMRREGKAAAAPIKVINVRLFIHHPDAAETGMRRRGYKALLRLEPPPSIVTIEPVV